MVIQGIIDIIKNLGYQQMQLNVKELLLYYTRVQEQDSYILLIDTKKVERDGTELYRLVKRLEQKLEERSGDFRLLNIVISDQVEEYRLLSQMDSSVWFIDRVRGVLMLYENQANYNMQLKQQIETLLDTCYERKTVEPNNTKKRETTTVGGRAARLVNSQTWYNVAFVIINVMVFLYMDLFLGDYGSEQWFDKYGAQWSGVFQNGEVYRIFTCMFIHSGINHLFNNMLILFFVGQILERIIPGIRFILIYLGSGTIAGLVSMGYNMINDEQYVVSVGASGAIFGLIGAMLYIVVINKGRLKEMSTTRILLFVGFSLYGGFQASNVDNAAHIGGIIAGLLLAIILYRRPKGEYNQ